MSTVILGMKSEAVHQILQSVDEQLEDQLQVTIDQTLEKVKNSISLEDSKYIFFQAHEIGIEAYNNLKLWSERTFITSPEKELAAAWIEGCLYRFEGPRSIQREIRQILSSKN